MEHLVGGIGIATLYALVIFFIAIDLYILFWKIRSGRRQL